MNGYQQQPQPPPLPQQPVQAPVPPQGDVESNKGWALLAYLGILLLIPLLAKKDSPYVWYHVKQGIVLLAAGILLGPVLVLLGVIFAKMGAFGGILMGLLSFAAWVVLFVLWVMGIVNALTGKTKPVPLIGGLAEKF